MGAVWSQSALIPPPNLTAANLPDQSGRVCVVTGGYSGIGLELVKILYSRNATVFVAGRDIGKTMMAIKNIELEHPLSTGALEPLRLDLADLSTIKPAVDEVVSKVTRLDVLVNNAGVMTPPAGSKTKQEHDLQLGVNCLGPYLLTQLLMPTLRETISIAPPNSVRVLWAGSVAVELSPPGGVLFSNTNEPALTGDQAVNYSISKAGNALLAIELARRFGKDGLVSVVLNPGNLGTQLQRHMPWWQYAVARLILYPPVLGAYTMLFAGWSTAITASSHGVCIWPWGRIGQLRQDIVQAAEPVECGGSGLSQKFWSWCHRETEQYGFDGMGAENGS